MKKSTVVFCIMAAVCFSASSHAELVFKITSDQTSLTVGQKTMVRVWGWADDPKAIGTNGLYCWSVDAAVDISECITVNSATILQPAPIDSFWSKASGLNSPLTGNLSALGIISTSATGSLVGIGNYTELFNFEIEAVGTGRVEYSLLNIVGELFDGTPFDKLHNNVTYNIVESGNVITVVPEPATLVILSGLGIAGLLSRRKK